MLTRPHFLLAKGVGDSHLVCLMMSTQRLHAAVRRLEAAGTAVVTLREHSAAAAVIHN